jgi:hypothetical protein
MIVFPYQLTVPSQGLFIAFADADELQKFLRAEAAFFAEMSNLFDQNVVFAGINLGNGPVTNVANRALGQILREITDNKFLSFETYVASAQQLRILIGQSQLGKQVKLLSAGDENSRQQARWMTYMLCTEWVENDKFNFQVLAPFRAMLASNPLTTAYADLNSTTEAMRLASLAAETSNTAKTALEQFIRQKTDLFDHLEQLYRTKLTLEEPALTWKKIAERKTTVWLSWLLVFALLVVIPLFLAAASWSTIVDAIAKVTAGANGTFSIAGLAVITVPALLYAWLLKNVSRIFIQNLNLADDAAHRRSLALTYMGLLQDEKHPASDQDRAIILNALFRPIPPQTADEGPPAGVVDLIRNK